MGLSLKAWRRARGVTQAEMAKLCEVAIPTYQKWEKNPGSIRIDNAIRIADKLQISLDDLILHSDTTNSGIA
jgi:transcriptional regulator with XRE-family HTH domain